MTQLQRTVLITGASSGIGKATARRLLYQGWKVIAAARTTESMSDLRESGAEVLPLDITDIDSRQLLVRQINQQFGALDALVNNAGFGEVGPLETMSIQTAQNLFDVNVFGLMALTQMLLPEMRKRGKGRVVNLSSIAGRFVTPGAGWYGASKFALEALSDALRLELHQFGIKVVIIEPGLIATRFETVAGKSFKRPTEEAIEIIVCIALPKTKILLPTDSAHLARVKRRATFEAKVVAIIAPF